MKSIICIFILMFLSGCTLSEEIGRDTVLREVRIVAESPLSFLEEEKEEFSGAEEKSFAEEAESLAEEYENGNEGKKDNSREKEENRVHEDKKEQGKGSAKTEESSFDEFAADENLKGTAKDFTDEKKAELMRKQQELYAYSTLEITQQNLYVEILYALENYVEEMEVSTKDTSEIDKVFQCVLLDHPELFYTDGYSFVKYTLGDEIKKITFKGTYIYDWEEKNIRQEKIRAAAMNLLKKLPADATDYEKVKYVYETIIHQTEYSLSAPDNQNICSVFLGQTSVCQGYAKAVQYLLQMLKVPATLVIGTVDTGEGHAWNMVKINNSFYYVDATWGDASYRYQAEEGIEKNSTPSINYDYLCVTTEEIMQTHSMGDLVPLPVCDSLESNYYIREGAYFTDLNYEQLKQLIDKYKSENRESVTLKCADNLVYQKMVEELLQNQKIFHYLQSENNSIIYTDSAKQRSLTFWL